MTVLLHNAGVHDRIMSCHINPSISKLNQEKLYMHSNLQNSTIYKLWGKVTSSNPIYMVFSTVLIKGSVYHGKD